MDRPTLSSNWSRVSRLKPVLRPRVDMRRQTFRSEPWYILRDPVSNSFFRLDPVSHHFVGLLDGKRSVEEAWGLTLERFGDDAPTQDEVIGLLGQLNESNLLRGGLGADAEPLLKRASRRRWQFWGGQAMNLLFLRIPLFNPEPILKWVTPLMRPALSRVGLVAWLAWLGYCLFVFLPHLGEFMNDARSVLAPGNWAWGLAVFIVTKAWHELGHGVMCKRFGGHVPETGVMMLVLFPAPFVDATSSWNFASKWRRLLVAAAGMMFELTVAGAAALIWVHEVQQGNAGLARQLAYNTVFIASITTLLFNANPLLRFDGYYMLSDLLEIPNLYERSKKQLYYYIQRFAYGMSQVYPPSTRTGETLWLVGYGIGAAVYRVLLLVGIILFVAGQLFAVGIVLAAWSFIGWMVVPTGKFIHWLLTNPQIGERRPRAVGVTLLTTAALAVLLLLWPMPEHHRAQGVIESATRSGLTIQTAGFVTAVHVRPGQDVRADQVLLEADDPELRARRAELVAEIGKVTLERNAAMAQDLTERRMRDAQLLAMTRERDEIDRRLDQLTVRSPQRGTYVGPDPQRLVGQYVKRGQVVGQVMDMEDLRITALIDQPQGAGSIIDPRGVRRVEVRAASRVQDVTPSRVVATFDSATRQLPHPALGQAGGGRIALDPQDKQAMTALDHHFQVWLELPDTWQEGARGSLPGERVFVRFTLSENRPVGLQWFDRFWRTLTERIADNTGLQMTPG